MAKITIADVPGVVVVRAGGAILGETKAAKLLEEAGLEPVLYIPRADMAMAFLDASETRTTCPWKGEAVHFHVSTESGPIRDAAWSYETPLEGVAAIAGMLAFYSEKAQVERL